MCNLESTELYHFCILTQKWLWIIYLITDIGGDLVVGLTALLTALTDFAEGEVEVGIGGLAVVIEDRELQKDFAVQGLVTEDGMLYYLLLAIILCMIT